MLKLYQIKQLKRLDRILFNPFKAFVFNAMIISAVLFSLKKTSEFSREHLYATYLMLLILIIFWRFIAVQSIKLLQKIRLQL